MPDFVKIAESLTIDKSQIKGNDPLLTLQPKKDTVLVSHGRPPWRANIHDICNVCLSWPLLGTKKMDNGFVMPLSLA